MMWIMKYWDCNELCVQSEIIYDLADAKAKEADPKVGDVRVWVLETEKLEQVAV